MKKKPVNPKSTAAQDAPGKESLKALFAMAKLSQAGLRNAVDLAEFKRWDLSGETGATLACFCALHSCGESLERLVALGAGFDGALRWSSKHCFMLAAANPPHADHARSAHFMKIALGLGAPVDQCEDGDGSTALYAAARTGNVEMARALLAAGADANRVNERGQRAGLFAYPMYSKGASRENEEILRMLAAAGMDLDAPLENDDDTTLLTWMFRNKHEAGVMALLDLGADIEARHASSESFRMLVEKYASVYPHISARVRSIVESREIAKTCEIIKIESREKNRSSVML